MPGKKFDLRIYALVSCQSPLTVWLYRTGFGRFSNTRYTVDSSKIDNLCMCVHRGVGWGTGVRMRFRGWHM